MARDFNQNRIANAVLARETLNKFGANFAVDYGLDGFNIVDIQTSEAPSNIVEYFEGNDTYEAFGLPTNITKLCEYALASFPSITDLYLFTDSVIDIEDDLSYLSNLTAIYVPQDLLSAYQTQYANVPNILNKLGTIPVDYELTIPVFDNIGNVLNEQAINYFLSGLSQAQKEALTKLIISTDYVDYYSQVWHYNFSEVFENLDNNIYYGNTQIDWTNYIIQGSGELTTGIVQDNYDNISVDKNISGIAKVTVPLSFTSYASGVITYIQSKMGTGNDMENCHILNTVYEGGEMPIDFEDSVWQDILGKITSLSKTLDEALVYARYIAINHIDNTRIYNDSNLIILPPMPSNKTIRTDYYNQRAFVDCPNFVYADRVYLKATNIGGLEAPYYAKEFVLQNCNYLEFINLAQNNTKSLTITYGENMVYGSLTQTAIGFTNDQLVEKIVINGQMVSTRFAAGIPNLSREVSVGLINSLGTPSEQKTLTIGATNLAKLTADDIAIATAKNWVVQ